MYPPAPDNDLFLDVGPASLDGLQCLILGSATADIVGHALPEATRANLSRHNIRAVEARARCIENDLGGFALQVGRVVGQNRVLMRRDRPTTQLDPGLD